VLQHRITAAGFSTDVDVRNVMEKIILRLESGTKPALVGTHRRWLTCRAVYESWSEIGAALGHNAPPIFGRLQNTRIHNAAAVERPVSSHYKRKDFGFAEPNAIIGVVSDIWLTVRAHKG
jgi:hypothetical protein